MDTSKVQRIALDDALVAPENRLKIGKCNQRLSSDVKSNEATLQVVLDALKLTPYYNAFLITASVLEIYMQEFWATVSIHHTSLRFKLNGRSHTLNKENFKDMLQICPKLPGQRFEDPIFEEEILSFIRDLGHSWEIKVLTDVNGMYHQKNVDYVYLLWEDLVYQVKNKNTKKNNDMCYPRFTKVIIDYYMSKDQSISRRNKMFWHTTRDDSMFTTIIVISKHQDTQIYGAILPDVLTNQDMLESKAYKEYYAFASGAVPPQAKTKYKKKADEPVTSPKTKTASPSKGTRIKSKAKMTKPEMKKQPAKKTKAKGLAVLSEVTLSEAEQIKLATKRSRKDFHISQASGSGDGVDTLSKVPDEQEQETFGTDEGTDSEEKGDNNDDGYNDDDGGNDDVESETTPSDLPTTPNTRIHKDHSLDNVIGDVQSRVLTRRMTKTTDEQGFIIAVYEEKSHEDLHTICYH
ncbi:hypothetical protein Tco_0700956 [Tanacetum coccineum]|uniref:Uncharacterized protein n=1 Tax=Tanacetum coccineum TaxID=301880 RepID=A0ABQ4WIR5_9ASTR